MTVYLMFCRPCDLLFEVEGSMAKPPKKKKCPECNKWGKREFTVPSIRTLKSIRTRSEKYAKYGMDKDTANNFLNNEIKYSKERMKTGTQHYRKVTPNAENMIKTGAVKRLSPEQAEQKKRTMIEMTKDARKRAPVNPHPQSI